MENIMTTRREMNAALSVAVTALFSGSGTVLDAQGSKLPADAIKTLVHEPLGDIPNPEASMLTLTIPPGTAAGPHKHPGPVFGYILQCEIENQVDPDPPKTYKTGDYFYEPTLHVHRMLRNLSKTVTAKILVFQIGEKGQPSTLGAE
jgi:quercetin dioxygenase-like cupin family protein